VARQQHSHTAIKLTQTPTKFVARHFLITMVNDTLTEDAIRPVSTEVASRPGQPTEPLEIEENSVPEVEINYPTGPKLWLTVTTLCVAMFLKGLVRSSNVITMANA
jgi:hypothetical protein